MRSLSLTAAACTVVLLAGCSGGTSSGTAASTVTTPATSPAPASSTPAPPVALPAGHRWMPVPALRLRLAVPSTWTVLDLPTLRDQVGTPAFQATADRYGYTVQELTEFTSSGAVAMAVGPDTADTAPNLLVRSVSGPAFTSGEQLTRDTRGHSGVLDAQSTPTTHAGRGVRGDFHLPVDGIVMHASQLAVDAGEQQDLVTVASADARVTKQVMDVVVGTCSRLPQP